MAFRSIGATHITRFNSSTSCDFLSMYENYIDNDIAEEQARKPSQRFAPSSFKCDRCSWFRLRGVEPDVSNKSDRIMRHLARIGTACHEMIQTDLSKLLKDDWLDVAEYLKTILPEDKYQVTKSENGLETQVEFFHIPIRFACDGLMRLNGATYLLEIKTSDDGTFEDLTEPRSIHMDQIKCYCTLLKVQHVIVMYIDRKYGTIKCYELTISEVEIQSIRDRFENVINLVNANIAPDRLPKGDPGCSTCKYTKKCKEWG